MNNVCVGISVDCFVELIDCAALPQHTRKKQQNVWPLYSTPANQKKSDDAFIEKENHGYTR